MTSKTNVWVIQRNDGELELFSRENTREDAINCFMAIWGDGTWQQYENDGYRVVQVKIEIIDEEPTAAAHYRHPDKPELVWAGRGRRPTWLWECLDQGRSLDDLKI